MSKIHDGPLPLAGLRVIDLSRDLAGPFCAQILADLGADVIKVEHPAHPDEMRNWPPLHEGLSTYFAMANRGKRCLTIDLALPRGREILLELARGAHVVIENFRLGVGEKLGAGYEQLAAVNPGIVLCSIRGYGPGPRENEPAYDAVIQAYSGIMNITGEPGGAVARAGVAVADLATAIYAANACQAWVRQAERSGRGGHVEISLFGSAVAMMSYQLVTYLQTGQVIKRAGTTHPALAPVKAFPTSTEDILIIAGHERHWREFCKVLERPAWAEDPRFVTNALRVENRTVLHEMIEEVTRTRPLDAWVAALAARGVPHAPVRTIPEVAADPQVRETMLGNVRRDDGVDFELVRSPIRLDGAALPLRGAPPAHRADTAEVLGELGYSAAEIAALTSAGVV